MEETGFDSLDATKNKKVGGYWNNMVRPDTRKKILRVFYRSEKDLSVGEVADKAGVSRKTASKWVDKLEEQGKIEKSREFGRVALYQLQIGKKSTEGGVNDGNTKVAPKASRNKR